LIDQLEARERDASGHACDVARLAVELASGLDLPPSDVRRIQLGAVVHDVGKLAVPRAILVKPGPLCESEWELMRLHPTAGEQFLGPVFDSRTALTDACMETVRAIVRWHHERWDGRGYPDGLRGDAIPLCARIVAVADAFQAMIERRPYRRTLSREQALAELEREAGHQFDPALPTLLAA